MCNSRSCVCLIIQLHIKRFSSSFFKVHMAVSVSGQWCPDTWVRLIRRHGAVCGTQWALSFLCHGWALNSVSKGKCVIQSFGSDLAGDFYVRDRKKMWNWVNSVNWFSVVDGKRPPLLIFTGGKLGNIYIYIYIFFFHSFLSVNCGILLEQSNCATVE